MTAFLFIPAHVASGATRRVDFANIASLFTEVDEPVHRSQAMRNLVRAAAAVLFLLLVVGDTLLVTRPSALPGPAACAVPTRAML